MAQASLNSLADTCSQGNSRNPSFPRPLNSLADTCRSKLGIFRLYPYTLNSLADTCRVDTGNVHMAMLSQFLSGYLNQRF